MTFPTVTTLGIAIRRGHPWLVGRRSSVETKGDVGYEYIDEMYVVLFVDDRIWLKLCCPELPKV